MSDVPVATTLPALLDQLSALHDLSDRRITSWVCIDDEGDFHIGIVSLHRGHPFVLGYVEGFFPDMDAVSDQLAGARAWHRARTKH